MGASLKSKGYAGYQAVVRSEHSGDASTPESTSGIFMWSGSKQLFGNTNDHSASKTEYFGVGMECVANSESYFRFRSKTGSAAGAGSELDVRTDTFFLGSSATFISGSGDGTIAITSSNFHLEVGGDITMAGTITAEAGGTIGGFTITSNDLYNLTSGTSTSSPNEGIVISSNLGITQNKPVINVYDDTPEIVAALGNYANGKQGIFAKEGNIGGWEINANYLEGENIIMSATGSLQTKDFQDGITTAVAKGWKISEDGTANFASARIRGTLSTTVFEKEAVSAIGGALIVANSTAIASHSVGDYDSSGLTAAHTTDGKQTLFVDNAGGFTANEWLICKSTSSTGFIEEWMKVTGTEITASPHSMTVIRGMTGGDSMAPILTPGQVLVSQGTATSQSTGTGYILLNATSGSTTPYIDIVERTGNTNFDDLDIKVRLGDLSGINDPSVGLDGSVDTFGLYTDNVYLKGTISASAGNIGGWTIDGVGGIYKFTSGDPGSSPNNGISISTTGSGASANEGNASISVYDGTDLKAVLGEYADGDFGIKADKGIIGGWTISSTALAKVDGVNTIALTPGAGIHLGAAALADAPFSVTKVGALKAVSGEIAGWTLSDDALTGGDTGTTIALTPGTGIHMGSASIADAPFSVTNAGAIKAESGIIGGWSLTDTHLHGKNLVIASTGSIATSDFQDGITTAVSKGWRIDQDGTANFASARIRGTLSTAVFEKETINAVGGAIIVANATSIASGSTYDNTDTELAVDNAENFVVGEWLICKAENSTGFTEEFMKVDAINTAADPQTITVERGAGGSAVAVELTPGQVLVSQGHFADGVGTGYVLINANPNDDTTPYIDVVERINNTDIAGVDIKVRLGDLSGINDSFFTDDDAVSGFGLYTENAFLKGGIVATFGKIGAYTIGNSFLQGNNVTLSNGNIRVGNANSTHISLDGGSDGNFKLKQGDVIRVQIDDNFIESGDTWGGIKIDQGLLHMSNDGGSFADKGKCFHIGHKNINPMGAGGAGQQKNVLAAFDMSYTDSGFSVANSQLILGNSKNAMIGVSSGILGVPHPSPDDFGAAFGELPSLNTTIAYAARAEGGNTGRNFSFYGLTGILHNEEEIRSEADVVAFHASDKRLKKSIKSIEHPLDKIKKIRGVKFNWKDKGPAWTKSELFGNPSGSLADVGIIAQEIKEVLPEVVRERKDGYLAVDYKKIVPLLIEGIKEQQSTIELLEARIKKLENK